MALSLIEVYSSIDILNNCTLSCIKYGAVGLHPVGVMRLRQSPKSLQTGIPCQTLVANDYLYKTFNQQF